MKVFLQSESALFLSLEIKYECGLKKLSKSFIHEPTTD